MIVIIGMINYRQFISSKVAGFTMIELLIVIAILGMMLAMVSGNYFSSLQRGRDAKRKAELGELKTALNLYYQDYQTYPAADHNQIVACGQEGALRNCDMTIQCSGEFETFSGSDCAAATPKLYMKTLPRDPSHMNNLSFKYINSSSDDFCLLTDLENSNDNDLATSHARCNSSCGGNCNSGNKYCMCAN
jgi:general secretion pathway protein G